MEIATDVSGVVLGARAEGKAVCGWGGSGFASSVPQRGQWGGAAPEGPRRAPPAPPAPRDAARGGRPRAARRGAGVQRASRQPGRGGGDWKRYPRVTKGEEKSEAGVFCNAFCNLFRF